MSEERKEYKEERFEIQMYINGDVICKRNFRINNFIEGSMNTLEFLDTMTEVKAMLERDLKEKTRVYLWHVCGPEYRFLANAEPLGPYEKGDELVNHEHVWNRTEESSEKKPEPYSTAIRFVVTDRNVPVYECLIDASCYPKYIRDRIDFTNRQEGVINDVKVRFEVMDKDRMSAENYLMMCILEGREDLTRTIVSMICKTCSPSKEWFESAERKGFMSLIKDYTTEWYFGDKRYPLNKEIRMNEKERQKTVQWLNSNKSWLDENAKYRIWR